MDEDILKSLFDAYAEPESPESAALSIGV